MIVFGEKPLFLMVLANLFCFLDASNLVTWLNGMVAVTGAIILLLNNVQSIRRKMKNLKDDDDKDTE